MLLVTAGMIGSGKTTLTTMLAEHLHSEPYYEQVKNNPVLPEYYANPKKYAFSLQIYFLNKRFESIKKAFRDNNNVLDRSIYEDALFTKANVDDGNISEVDYKIYLELLQNMMQEMACMPKKAPDLLIFLNADFDTILKHIKKRGRDYEQVDTHPDLLAYYRDIWTRYQSWYDSYNYSPKMYVDLSNQDLTNPKDKKIILGQIDNKLAEIRG